MGGWLSEIILSIGAEWDDSLDRFCTRWLIQQSFLCLLVALNQIYFLHYHKPLIWNRNHRMFPLKHCIEIMYYFSLVKLTMVFFFEELNPLKRSLENYRVYQLPEVFSEWVMTRTTDNTNTSTLRWETLTEKRSFGPGKCRRLLFHIFPDQDFLFT